MKKLLLVLLISILVVTLCACENGAKDKPIINDSDTLEDNLNNAVSGEPSEVESPSDANETEPESTEEYYSNVVYKVGEEIPAGGYVIDCTNTEYGMDITIFDGEESYDKFQNEHIVTFGDYYKAVEQFAWADFYLELGEQAYINLHEGFIVLLDGGKCEFTKYDPADSPTIYPGIYVVGEDIDPQKVNIKCSSEYIQVSLFESKEKYLDYHKTERSTIGEESEAIEKYAESSVFFYENDITYANLQAGMIILVEDGIGEYSIADGPVIN